jgi:hypothetical protein
MRLDKSKPWEWQCPTCAAWVPGWAGRHVHVKTYQPDMSELRQMRAAEEAGLEGIVPDAFEKATLDTYWWTGAENARNVT